MSSHSGGGCESPDASLSRRAQRLIAELGPATTDDPGMLVHMLASHEQNARVCAVVNLGRIRATSAIPHLLEIGRDVDSLLREWVVWALAEIDHRDPSVIEHCLSALHDASVRVREMAVRGLARGKPDPRRLPELIQATADVSATVRRYSLAGLAAIAPTRAEAVAPIVRALADSEASVRQCARHALTQLGSRAAEELINGLENGPVHVRVQCAEILEACGLGVARALLDATKDQEPSVRAAAIEAIGKIGRLDDESASGPISQTVHASLEDRSSVVRRSAAKALGRPVGQVAKAVLALVGCLDDPSLDVRQAALLSLAKLAVLAQSNRPLQDSIDSLCSALEDDNPDVRCYAVWVLEKLGSRAASAIASLQNAMRDEDPIVRQSAAWALERIR